MDSYKFAVEVRESKRLAVRKKKGKITVKDGSIWYPIRPFPPSCACEKYVEGAGCRHVFRVLSDLGWSVADLRALPHSASIEAGQSEGANECMFCMCDVKRSEAWLCSYCKATMHLKCANRWLKSGKGCPVCSQLPEPGS